MKYIGLQDDSSARYTFHTFVFVFLFSNEDSQFSQCVPHRHQNECIVENVFNIVEEDMVIIIKVDAYNALGNNASNELVLQLLDIGDFPSLNYQHFITPLDTLISFKT